MREWTIDTEETQKYLERYSENRYLVESRGYNKDTFMEEIWIFVNEIIDWRTGKDKDEEIGVSDLMKISHLFRVDHYLICVYTSSLPDFVILHLNKLTVDFCSCIDQLLYLLVF